MRLRVLKFELLGLLIFFSDVNIFLTGYAGGTASNSSNKMVFLDQPFLSSLYLPFWLSILHKSNRMFLTTQF